MSQRQVISFGNREIVFFIEKRQRKTLSIQVHPDTSVHVVAPDNADNQDILRKVKAKAAWITRQQNYFSSFLPTTPPRQYINGETHLYLGRQYRLKKIPTNENRVKLYRGYIEVHTGNIDINKIKIILSEWYKNRAHLVFTELFTEIIGKHKRFQNKTVKLYIKNMRTRWGSCSPSGRITLNIELIKAPKACIEYVIVHELCHLLYPNHNKAFYRLLYSTMPDWEIWKDKLEKSII